MIKNRPLTIIAIVLIIIGALITILYLVFLCSNGWRIRFDETSIAIAGQVGDYIGGFVGTVFSLSGFIFLLLTLKEQKGAFQKERFENKFFEMVKYHRENVQEMYVPRTDKGKYIEPNVYGKRVFKFILDQITEALKEVTPFFVGVTIDKILGEGYIEEIKQNRTINERNIDLIELSKLNLAYLIVFFGVHEEGYKIIEKFLHSKYQKIFYEPILNFMRLKPISTSKNWSKWNQVYSTSDLTTRNKIVDKIYEYWESKSKPTNDACDSDILSSGSFNIHFYYYGSNYNKYYGGHQFRLGHYFRHFFQSINYVNDTSLFPFEEKYEYGKFYRAQLSTYEQAILFFNSLSSIGLIWEFNPKYKKSNLSTDITRKIVNNQLITKYNLIKNIPGEHIAETVIFQNFYPDVEYELQEKTSNKKSLENSYH